MFQIVRIKAMGKEFPKKRVTYHEWPKDENIKKWKTEIQKTKSVANGLLAYSEIKVKDYKVICSDHFEESCFLPGKVRRLTKTAIPTLFLTSKVT